jgi:drug/metabolite transporter (DMT)-like permease
MSNYVLIFLAVVLFAAQFAFTRLYEGAVKQSTAAALVLLVVTGLVGAFQYLLIGGFRVEISPVSLMWAVLMALTMLPYYVVGIQVLSLGSLAIYSMFMMLGGMLVPFFYGILFLDEAVSWGKITGTVLLTVFIVLQAASQPAAEKKAVGWKKYLFFALCMVIFFINGMTCVIAKAHQVSVGAADEVSFTVLSCGLTALLSALLLPFAFLKDRRKVTGEVKQMLHWKPLLMMVCVGAAGYTGNFLHLIAAGHVPASVQFPLVSGGVIILSALVSAFGFREKLSAREWLSVAGAFASTVLFAF